jgi:hypothetical protein
VVPYELLGLKLETAEMLKGIDGVKFKLTEAH